MSIDWGNSGHRSSFTTGKDPLAATSPVKSDVFPLSVASQLGKPISGQFGLNIRQAVIAYNKKAFLTTF